MYMYMCACVLSLVQEPVVEDDGGICSSHSFCEPPIITTNLFQPFGFSFPKKRTLRSDGCKDPS